MRRDKVIACLLGMLLWLGSAAPVAVAEEAAVQYQILDTLQGFNSATWILKLELRNLTGEELQNLSVSLVTSTFSNSNESAISVGTLSTTEPRRVTADFIISNEYLPLDESSLRFSLQYKMVDGTPRSAILQGQPVVFMGEATP